MTRPHQGTTTEGARVSSRTIHRRRRHARAAGHALTGREAVVLAGLVILAGVHTACLRAGLGPAGEGQRWFVAVAAAGLVLKVVFAGLVVTRAGASPSGRGRRGGDVR